MQYGSTVDLIKPQTY